jgi:HK97 family phage major capsid protein
MLYREATILPETVKQDDRTVELTFSSELPVDRYFGAEVLSHREGAVRLERLNSKAPFLLNHDPADQIGVVEKAYIGEGQDRRGRARIRFSRSQRAEEIYQDVVDGIRPNISVGYAVYRMEEVEENGREFWLVTDWEPMEISSVSIPADYSVGVGRSSEEEFETIMLKKEAIEMADEKKIEVQETPKIDVNEIREKARKEENDRVRNILAMGEQFKQKDDAQKFVSEGKSVEEFRAHILDKIGNVRLADTSPDIGMDDNEVKSFSFVRAINAIISGDWSKAGLEKRASEAMAAKLKRSPQGFFVPNEVLKRDLTVGSTSGGGYTVATDLLASNFIELLRNKLAVRALGARILGGLVGNVAIPSQTGGATSYWVTEGNAPTESQQVFGQVTMSPKTVGAFTDISRKLLIQSSIDVEAFVRNDLASVLALEIDRAAINGSGSGAEPRGILNTSGIGNVGTSPAAPTYANIIALWKEVATDNADIGSLAFLTNPAVVAKLMQVFTNSTYGEMPVWQGGPGDGTMLGYRAMCSNQVPANLGSSTGATTGVQTLSAIIFGNFADLIIGEWSGVDITVDPYTASSSGTVRVVALQDVDIAVRHAGSFAAMKEVDAA